MSDEGTLAYSYQLFFGSVTKEMGFTIQLEKKMEIQIIKINQRRPELQEQLNKNAEILSNAEREENMGKAVFNQ